MKKSTVGARWQAAGTAALLFVTGGMMGIVVDRLWVSPPEIHARPLTAEALSARLNLSAAEEAHLQALLDSLHVAIVAAVQQGPESLRAAVRNAQHRIEGALPANARSEFRAWIHEHHEQMMGRMHGVPTDPGMVHGGASSGILTRGRNHRP